MTAPLLSTQLRVVLCVLRAGEAERVSRFRLSVYSEESHWGFRPQGLEKGGSEKPSEWSGKAAWQRWSLRVILRHVNWEGRGKRE